MSSAKRLTSVGTTIQFPKFWTWLQGHANCILRAGTSSTSLFDQDDVHWTLVAEDKATFVVQLARAKEMVGELVIFPADIAYVQSEPTEHEGEWLFECVAENEGGREVSYQFLMAHEYEAGEHRATEKWTH